ncbi:MAG: hypothetical protein E7037_06585 [Verrucomicrobia bacterium]|nr:hypothetical protein [Verrucomicrobiota bacterium]
MFGFYSEYVEFNNWVYERFFAPNLHSGVSVAALLAEVDEIRNHPSFGEACKHLSWTEDWHGLDNLDGNTPRYIGLIAIQVLAAFECHADKQKTDRAYNPELCKLLDNISLSELQKRYKGNGVFSGQDEIYESFGIWCEKNGLSVSLPPKKKGSNRYVQYPDSLSLLNKENLKQIDFKRDFVYGEEIDFDKFKQRILRGRYLPPYLPIKVEEKINQIIRQKGSHTRDAILLQIFIGYKNWDGTQASVKYDQIKSRQPGTNEYLLYWDDLGEFVPELECNGIPVPLDSILSLYKKGAFFVRESDDSICWRMVSEKIESISKYLYICSCKAPTDFWKKIIIEKDFFPKEFDHYRLIVVPEELVPLQKKSDAKSGISLSGGFKIGWRQWMQGGGPETIGSSNSSAGLVSAQDGKYNVINLQKNPLVNLPAGLYLLKGNATAPQIHFEIVDPKFIDAPSRKNLGWNPYPFIDAKEETSSCGLNFSLLPATESLGQSPLKAWIKSANETFNRRFINRNLINTKVWENT